MPSKKKTVDPHETDKMRFDRLKAESHARHEKKVAANAAIRKFLKLPAGAPIPQGYGPDGMQPTHNRRSRRAMGLRRGIKHGYRRRQATRAVMPGFEPPWRQRQYADEVD